MKLRVIASLVYLPLLMVPLYFGGIYCLVLVLLISTFATYEYNKAFGLNYKLTQIVTILASCVYYAMIYIYGIQYLEGFLVIYFIALVSVYVIEYPKYHIKDMAILMFGFIYTNLMFSYILLVRLDGDRGRWYVWLIFLIAFGSDIFAYFIGKRFGKHKLTPKLSPNKTIEGAIGGLFGAAIFCMLYGVYMYIMGGTNDLSNLPQLAILGFFGSILAQIGDLVASGIKRSTNIKDFGKVIPGHGGVLDRFDSNVLLAPLVYYLMLTILKII